MRLTGLSLLVEPCRDLGSLGEPFRDARGDTLENMLAKLEGDPNEADMRGDRFIGELPALRLLPLRAADTRRSFCGEGVWHAGHLGHPSMIC